MKRDFYESPKGGKIMRLFWKAAGGDRYILERATYSDQVKYMCLGGIIVSTGVMAALAGGYGFYTIFSPRGSALDNTLDMATVFKSILFGLIWGLIIFNIDRFIVSSTGKGDGTEKITKEEFKSALPRIIMGAIIALTISKPLEIKMFETEIGVELAKEQKEKQMEYVKQIESIYRDRIEAEKKKIQTWNDEIEAAELRFVNAEKAFNEELSEKPAGSTTGYGSDAKRLEIIMNDRRADRNMVRSQNGPLISQSNIVITNIESEKKRDIDEQYKVANSLDGLLERIKLAHKIAGFWISLFITLLFMAIELTPIFFKLMLIRTPYDYLSENRDHLLQAEAGIEIKYDYYEDRTGLERHLVIHHGANKLLYEKLKLTEIQKALTDYAAEKYIEREKSKIDANLNEYVTEQSPSLNGANVD